MLSAEQNDLIARTGTGTPAGGLMRRYWQPAALVDELSGNRPVKPVRLFGEDLVIFKDDKGRYGLIGRRCPHQAMPRCSFDHVGSLWVLAHQPTP